MTRLVNWLPLFLSVVVLAGAWFTAKAGSWRGEAEAQKQRGDRLEKEVNELKARVAILEDHNKALSDLITAAPAIGELKALIAHDARKNEGRHEENLGHLSRIEGGLSRVEDAVIPRQRRPQQEGN